MQNFKVKVRRGLFLREYTVAYATNFDTYLRSTFTVLIINIVIYGVSLGYPDLDKPYTD